MNLEQIQKKIDNLNKPKGSLGRLEDIAAQLCLIQNTLNPTLTHPCHLLFGGDHGIESEGVSLSPREVTWQQMENFARGGGGVNMFCRQHGFELRIIDVGVDHDLSNSDYIIDRKIRQGTRNFLYQSAMTERECGLAIAVGAEQVDECYEQGCNIISIGEMGIANTSPSSVWMSVLCNIPLEQCVGAGSGLDDAGIAHKVDVLTRAVNNYHSEYKCNSNSQLSTLRSQLICYFGGYEMVAAMGAMLRAAEHHMVVLIDGFIMTACALVATKIRPEVQQNMIFCHCGDEAGHRLMLDAMGAKPLLDLGLRLGEGTGALCAYPLVESAARMMTEMNNFQDAGITKYF